jgi:hypothetical protein
MKTLLIVNSCIEWYSKNYKSENVVASFDKICQYITEIRLILQFVTLSDIFNIIFVLLSQALTSGIASFVQFYIKEDCV